MSYSSTSTMTIDSHTMEAEEAEQWPMYQSRPRFGALLGTVVPPTTWALYTPPVSTRLSDTDMQLFEPYETRQQLKFDRVDLTIIARIRELGAYPSGWNRPDSVTPSAAAVEDAERFARSMNLTSIHLPRISTADDGEINFWWDFNGLYIDLGFFGDGSYSFYSRLPNGKEITVDQAPISQPLPPEILKYLKKSV